MAGDRPHLHLLCIGLGRDKTGGSHSSCLLQQKPKHIQASVRSSNEQDAVSILLDEVEVAGPVPALLELFQRDSLRDDCEDGLQVGLAVALNTELCSSEGYAAYQSTSRVRQ